MNVLPCSYNLDTTYRNG